ncbi:MAG: sulfatase [Verrucomicrobiota bacterium]
MTSLKILYCYIKFHVLLALVVSLAADTIAAESSQKLNVLLIVVDDLRTELGCYGVDQVHSPNIDRLSQKGMLFENAYSQYPVCNPSRSSFLSGLRPDEVGITSNIVPFRRVQPDLVTLPQLFRNNGYFTAGLGKIFHLSIDNPNKRVLFEDPKSWDYFYDALGKTTDLGRRGEGRNLTGGEIPWARWKAAEGDDIDQPDGQVAAAAVRILEENQDKPFFIGYGIHKPHDPFISPQKYFDYYPKGTTTLPAEPEDRSPLVKYAIPNKSFERLFTDKERIEFKRAYHAGVSFADAQVGKTLDTLDKLDLWDSTIVILMGDHGYHLGEKGWWNKVTLFEDGARAPMIIWAPGMSGMGRKTDSIMEFIDLYPTLADLAQLQPPHPLSGTSLRPILEDPDATVKEAAFTQVNSGGSRIGRSVRSKDWRYTEWGKDGADGIELYNHVKDSAEYYNLAENPEYSDIRKLMKKQLDQSFGPFPEQ